MALNYLHSNMKVYILQSGIPQKFMQIYKILKLILQILLSDTSNNQASVSDFFVVLFGLNTGTEKELFVTCLRFMF